METITVSYFSLSFVFLLSLGAHAVFSHERMSHREKSWEKKEAERERVIKSKRREGGQKTLKQIGHYGDVRRPIPHFDHPISWGPRGQSRWRRRGRQVDKLMWWTQKWWTGCIPFLTAYLLVTSPASSRVHLPGKLNRNGNKEQKCTTSEDMEQYGHFSRAHFKEYLMLHIFIFVRR